MFGKFITFEGADGSGKTTALHYVAEQLTAAGHSVLTTREPGGSELGDHLRTLLFREDTLPLTEMLLLAAGRAQHIEQVIKPALLQGKIVLCDRFADSTYAYQGAGRGYTEKVLQLEELVCGDFAPHQTLYFDVSLEESLRRLAQRSSDKGEVNRLDGESLDFKRRVLAGYGLRFETHKHRMYRIAAETSLEEVQAQLRDWITYELTPTIGKRDLKVVK